MRIFSAARANSYPPPAPRRLTINPPFRKSLSTCSINLAGVPDICAKAAACFT